MEKWNFVPLKSINGLNFGISRGDLQKQLDLEFEEFQKNEFSKNTADDYGDFHVHYDSNNRFEAIEFFDGEYEIILDGFILFPSNIRELKEKVLSLNSEDDKYFIDIKNSIGFEIDDKGNLSSILLAKKDYFNVEK